MGDVMSDRRCGTPGCKELAIGIMGKFGETRQTGSPVNTPPGQRITINYCAKCEDTTKRFLAVL